MFASHASAPHARTGHPGHGSSPSAASAGAALVSVDGAHAFPLQGAHLAARAEGGMAYSTFRQHFRNPHAEPLEVVYVLPLPADGAVLGYRVTVGDRVIRGEIRTREAAQKAYRDALYQGRTAGLLEQERADTFRQQLGNIPARTAVKVEIDVLHPLAFRPATPASPLAQWEYRFPTTVGVRYMGGAGRVPDAPRIDPDRADPTAGGTPARLTLALEVAGLAPEADVVAPGHALELSEDVEGTAEAGASAPRSPGRRVTATLVEPTRLDRDMVARWDAPAPEIGVHLVEGTGLGGDGGDGGDAAADPGRYALVTVVPPAIPGTTFARDLTILLDTSGSMHGLPLELGKAVVERLLRSLGPEDRFEVLTFGSTVERFANAPIVATEGAVGEAVRRLRTLQASGCTEMRAAVAEALRPLRSHAQRQVVLVTDGYIGFEGEVVAEAMTRLPSGVRFHAVGVGAAPNRTLTGGLARAGRGLELFAQDGASAAESAELLLDASVRPVLTELAMAGSALVAQSPARPRDVAAGHPVVLTVELAPGGGTLELAGHVAGPLAGSVKPWRWSVEIPARPGQVQAGDGDGGGARAAPGGAEAGRTAAALPRTPLPLGALHGRERIADLELEEAAGAGRVETDARIEATALRHRIVSRRTSLVAVSDAPTVDPSEPTRRETVPVELPAGMSAEMVGLHRVGDTSIDFAVSSRVLHAPSAYLTMEGDLDDGGPLDSVPDVDFDPREAFMEHRVRSAPSGWGRRESSAPSRPLDLGDARVLRLEGGELVIEIEVPHDGFHLPGGDLEVRVELGGGGVIRARVDASASTRVGPHGVGPHRAGTRVRLALRLVGHGHWPTGEVMRLAWDTHAGAPGAFPSPEGSFRVTVRPEDGLGGTGDLGTGGPEADG